MNTNVVSSTWLNANLNNSNLILLDSSQKSNTNNLYSRSNSLTIPNSIPFDLKKFSDPNSKFPNTLLSEILFKQKARELGINKDSVIVVFDKLGIYSSPRVWWLFKVMGHKNVFVLDGGLPNWIKNGFKTINKKENHIKTTMGDFKAQLNTTLVRNFKDIRENLSSKKEIIIDARSPDRFNALVPEPRAGLRGGNIPESLNLPYETVLTNGLLKSNKELKNIFEKLNLTNKSLIFSCGSGITACIVLLAYDQINKNPKSIYDGSWTEWAQLSEI